MIISANGRIGVGTSTPSTNIDVRGTNYTAITTGMLGSTGVGSALRLLTESTLTSTLGDSSSKGWAFEARSPDYVVEQIRNDLELYYWNGTIWNLGMKWAVSGMVGIGTNYPTHRLSIEGHASKTTGGDWSVFSDKRIKKNIQNYTKGLDEIIQIRPVIFNYNEKSPFKNPSNKPMVGVIAQEIQKVLPNTVSTKKTEHFDDLLEYNSSELLYTLINAVKELKVENDALKARLDILEN